jgi:hypothetical protein
MATVRSRTAASSGISLQTFVPSSSQSGAQTSTSQATQSYPAKFQSPVVTPPATPSPQGATQEAPPLASSPSAVLQDQQIIGCSSIASFVTASSSIPSTTPTPVNGSSPIPGSPPTTPVAVRPTPITTPRMEKWIKRINGHVGRISIILALISTILALVFGISAWIFGAKALASQVWSARNDFRDSCWTDWDHEVYSRECNETLAHSVIPPPSKRTEAPPKRGVLEPDYINLSVSFISVIITIIPLVPKFRKQAAAPLFSGKTRALHRQTACEVDWTDYCYSWTKTTPPFLRRTRLFWTLKVSVVLSIVLTGFLFLFFSV